MKTVQAGENAVSIWFRGETPPARRQAISLVREALAERGLPPWPRTRVEMFSAGEDTLLIARPAGEGRAFFFFPELEALLAGAAACPAGRSSLYAAGRGGYILAVDAADVRPGLYEFGEPAAYSEAWERHAAEQGACILRDAAVGDLRRIFGI